MVGGEGKRKRGERKDGEKRGGTWLSQLDMGCVCGAGEEALKIFPKPKTISMILELPKINYLYLSL